MSVRPYFSIEGAVSASTFSLMKIQRANFVKFPIFELRSVYSRVRGKQEADTHCCSIKAWYTHRDSKFGAPGLAKPQILNHDVYKLSDYKAFVATITGPKKREYSDLLKR